VQVDPIKPKLKAPGTNLLKLIHDVPLSTFGFNFNLRRYTEEAYRKYDELASKHVEQLRKLTKQIQARPAFLPELRFTLGITVLIPESSA